MLKIYWQGLREPLPFFPKSSYTLASQTKAERNNPRGAALAIWEGNSYREVRGEKDDPYIELAFRNGPDPLGEEWERLSLQIFGPLLAHCEEKKL